MPGWRIGEAAGDAGTTTAEYAMVTMAAVAFAAKLQQEIETATAGLVAEGERALRAENIRPAKAAS